MKHPTKIGKYEVIDVIGRGGMGVVYKATDPQLDRLVAIKMMTVGYAEDPEVLKRFYREAQSTAKLHHANIVVVYDLGDQDGNPYLVMEYLEGESLDAVISSRRALTVLDKVQLILETCRGLSYAHERGVVHRDIKPGNIMVSKNGSAKLVDFGIAHIASKTLTRTGQIMGSINYMSPEQINGRPPVDQRTDIFSTGVVLYQLFTYVLPFEGESTAATMFKIMQDPPPPLDRFLKVYPKELESIVLRALAKNREDRYPSADEFALDLLQVHEQLKQELVVRNFREAETFLRKGDLNRAKDELLQLLKLDQKHTQALRLLRQVQQRLEKEQGVEQARQLRAQAEESYTRGEFEAALLYLDRAIAIDATNLELPNFRERIRETKLKSEELQRVLRRAETAHERGDLDAAKQAADEALEINSSDTQAKALYRIIHRDWVERSRQRQLEALLELARKEINARNLTAALNILRQAQTLDPEAPRVRALVEEVSAVRDQERRREELERIKREVDEALNRDDYEIASVRVEQGLAQFPEDRGLIQCKALVVRQRAAAERRLFVQQQASTARQLLDAGKANHALACLKNALREVPHEPELETLLAAVQEQVVRDEQARLREGLEAINREIEAALNREDYQAASNLVEEGLKQFPQHPALSQLKSLVERQRAAADRKFSVRQQIATARKLLDAGQARQALTFLQGAIEKFPQEAQLEALLSMVRERVVRDEGEQAKARSIQQARDAMSRHAYAEAVQILETAQVRFLHSPEIDDILHFAREQEVKESGRKAADGAIRRAQQWISEHQYERAIQLLETTFRQAPDDQLRVILEEARRRSDDYQTGLQAAIAKAKQFLREGSAAKAIEFLNAQPASYRRSEQFSEVLKAANSLPKLQPVTAADQKATVIMNGMPSPSPVTERTSTTQLPPRQPRTDAVSEGQPQPAEKRTKAVIVAVALVVLVVCALEIWKHWPTSPPVGTLTVQTNVASVEVYANGILEGTTNDAKQLKIQINEGSYEIHVQKEGYDQTPSRRIEIAKHRETSANFELTPVPPPPLFKGTLTVRTNVGAVDVFVDNVRKGATGNNKKLDVPDISVGNHEIHVEKQGYSQLPAQRVEIKKDSVLSVSFTLTVPKEDPGYLDIKATPGAEVRIDGKTFGTVQPDGTLRIKMEPGGHRVELGLNGYESWSQAVTVKQGKSAPVNAEMKLVPVARPTVTFNGSADKVQQGQAITLTWETTNASEVTIDGIGAVQPSGSREVRPTDTTTYTLTAKGPGGTTTANPLRVVVVPNPKPSIAMFAANASTIQQGETVTLSWQTANATEVSISGVASGLSPSGSLQVTPTETTTYKLIAKGPGGVVPETKQVVVEPKPEPQKPTGHGPTDGIPPDIKTTLDALSDAYESMTIAEVQRVWPSLSGEKRRRLDKDLFQRTRALKMRLTSCKETSTAGNGATVECAQSLTYTIDGQRPTRTNQVIIKLEKAAAGWQVDDVSGQQ